MLNLPAPHVKRRLHNFPAPERCERVAPCIVKIGGSVMRDSARATRIFADVARARRRLILVAGGGRHADAVRDRQKHEALCDTIAHRQAIAATEITAREVAQSRRCFRLAATWPHIGRAWQAGAVPIFLPTEMMADDPELAPDWSTTSDAIAVRLAELFPSGHRDAARVEVVLVKSCAIAKSTSLRALRDRGVIDPECVRLAARSGLSVSVIGPRDRGLRQKLWAIDATRAPC